MPAKPRSLVILTACLLAIAISIPLQVFFLEGHTPQEWQIALAKITYLNWATIVSLVLEATVIFQASPWALVMAPLSIAIVNWNNVVVGHYELQYSFGESFYATVAFSSLHLLLFTKESRRILLAPALRWWLRPRRHRLQWKLQLQRLDGTVFAAKTFDLSRYGAFIPFADMMDQAGREFLPLFRERDQECVMLRLTVGDLILNFQAKVVRKNGMDGIYPPGIGVQFLELNRRDQRRLERLLTDEQKVSAIPAKHFN